MSIKQIKKLAKASYTKENLDQKKVNKISKLLTRGELKTYIKAIKNQEKERTITLFAPKINAKNTVLKDLKRLFPDKKILFREDNSLLAGIRIVNKDDIYDFNVKNTLENLVSYIRN